MFLTSFSRYQPRVSGRFVQALVDDVVSQAIAALAERVFDTSQALVPVDTGELKSSGHVIVNGKYAAVEYTAGHAVYVEYGTGIRGAASAGAGPGPYSSTWPGMPAQPYLRPAYDQHRAEAADMTREFVGAALKG